MKKATKIFTVAAFVFAVYMLVLYIFLSLCVELHWTFIYSLPAAADWFLGNVLINLFKAGTYVAPTLTGLSVVLSVISAVKAKSAAQIDLSFLITTVIFTLTASIISAIDSSVITTFS